MPVTEPYRNRALILALTLLLTLQASAEGGWRPMLFFAHIGAVLMWQPLVPHKRSLTAFQIALVAGVGALLAALLSPWVLLAWATLLTGLAAGRITMLAPRSERALYMAILGFMVVVMFLLLVPDLLPLNLHTGLPGPVARRWLIGGLALALLPLALLAWRADVASAVQQRGARRLGGTYDLVYTTWVVSLLLLLIFFGIALMALSRLGYLESMAITLVGFSTLLLTFSWVWAGFDHGDVQDGAGSGLSVLLSRYLLSFGLPYEVWLDKLTTLNRTQSDPVQFFDGAMHALGDLAIVAGAEWRGVGVAGSFGVNDGGEAVRITAQTTEEETRREIEVVLRTREALSPSFLWHFQLLVGLAAEFYWAKVREARLLQRNYLRAVHETGARLTHDVKNLLQTLDGLVEAIACVENDTQVRKLVGRQLPEISARLAATLAKLQAPATDSQRLLNLSAWWSTLARRYESEGVTFCTAQWDDNLPIIEALFDSAAENMIGNALRKRSTEPALTIQVSLVCQAGVIAFSVQDSGAAIPAEIVRQLFHSPVASRDGLGIGLFQLAEQALAFGYQVLLTDNSPGYVRLALTNHAAGQRAVELGESALNPW